MRSVTPDDRTARARIRDAGVARFAADGFGGATVRAIAGDAGVSPALVLHHFGSKEGLRRACDEHVVAVVMSWVEPWLARPSHPGALLEVLAGAGDLLGYVRRALVEGGAGTDRLVDRFIGATEQLLAEGEARGLVRPSSDPRGRAAVLVLWDLATVVLGAHLRRALGEEDEQVAMSRYGEILADVYGNGLFRQPPEGRVS